MGEMLPHKEHITGPLHEKFLTHYTPCMEHETFSRGRNFCSAKMRYAHFHLGENTN